MPPTRRLTSRTSAPTLETERLILRAHAASDFADLLAMWQDPEVTRHITRRASTHEEGWARLQRYAGNWALLGYGFWAVTEKGTGRFAGDVGAAHFEREMQPGFDGDPEVGWVLSPAFQGKGYATEAVRAALAWCDRELRTALACMIGPANAASLRVAAKCGFREFHRGDHKNEPVVLFRRPIIGT
jgi:RimJ/RimL family protein N-acetyltransferase